MTSEIKALTVTPNSLNDTLLQNNCDASRVMRKMQRIQRSNLFVFLRVGADVTCVPYDDDKTLTK